MQAIAILVTLVAGYLVTQTVGYLIHQVMHNRLAGRVYQAHKNHHELYSAANYLSKAYRDVPWGSKPIIYYAVPALSAMGVAFWLLPLPLAVIFAAELLIVAYLNDWLHSAFHIEEHWLGRFAWFQRLRQLHRQHHADEAKNLGIFDFTTDRALGTYQKPA